ncbi:MAG: 3'-5' exonuclease [Oscillospiraceae bacterium]|nr:3'-5' exonuclease [Oscillospiraceae bacterium]
MPDSLFHQFENIIVFDVETTGLNPRQAEIIEIAALRVVSKQGSPEIEDEFNLLVTLPPDKTLPAVITNLTGITEAMLISEGVSRDEAYEALAEMLGHPDSLLVAYNAQFDLCFLYYFLQKFQDEALLKNFKMLDAMTVYKDRKPFPHKLVNAIAAYAVTTPNTHRASDDARATFELLCKMSTEADDLDRYINLFGYNAKYGVPKPQISSVNYLPQRYTGRGKLYEV